MRWATWTSATLGLWLIVAPFALGYTTVSTPLAEDMLGGILIASVALSRALGGQVASGQYVTWLQALAGLWVLVAPAVLGYSAVTAAAYNDAIVGGAVLILATWRALATGHAEIPHTAPHH